MTAQDGFIHITELMSLADQDGIDWGVLQAMLEDYMVGMAKSPLGFRIARTDPYNLAIQRRTGKTWKTLSYHGNSLSSLAAGLAALIVGQCDTPEGEDLAAQVADIARQVAAQSDRILASIRLNGV